MHLHLVTVMLLVLAAVSAQRAGPATGHHWIIRIPHAPCDNFDCNSYALTTDGRGACAVSVSVLLDFATSAGPIDSVTHVIDARKDPTVAGYCSDVSSVDVVGIGATRVASSTTTKLQQADGALLLGYTVAVQLAVATENPAINVTYVCEDALQHWNIYLQQRVVAHMYSLALTLLSQSSLTNPKGDIILVWHTERICVFFVCAKQRMHAAGFAQG